MNVEKELNLPHGFQVKDRHYIYVSGVTEVISFDDTSIFLKTNAGGMAIEGSGLKIGKLSLENGELCADGKIDSVYYFNTDKKGKGSFFGGGKR
ncbi:MAG: YabP/YqfC family sporulation protein [Clostridia bacterium]|nr:YabP/YqfC family sporulation protein [Clostridia bacterium]